jgi:hypothetical protein
VQKFTTHLSILHLGYAVHAQHVEVIQPPKHADTSFYDIIKIDDNKFWAAGEKGVLIVLDSMGNSIPVNCPLLGVDIMNITINATDLVSLE